MTTTLVTVSLSEAAGPLYFRLTLSTEVALKILRFRQIMSLVREMCGSDGHAFHAIEVFPAPEIQIDVSRDIELPGYTTAEDRCYDLVADWYRAGKGVRTAPESPSSVAELGVECVTLHALSAGLMIEFGVKDAPEYDTLPVLPWDVFEAFAKGKKRLPGISVFNISRSDT